MELALDSIPFQGRRTRVRKKLEARDLPALLVTNPRNLFYLTGFRGSAGVAVFNSGSAILWVDPRYALQAQEEARGVEVLEERGPLLKAATRWLRKRKMRKVGFEDSHLTVAELRALERAGRGMLRFEPASGIIEGLRFVKDQDEISLIREACRITSETFQEIIPLVRPGAKECDIAAAIEYRMRLNGSDGAAFDTIVASGCHGAFPHAHTSAKVLEKSELVIFDMGAILGGYAADMTRTLYLGGRPGRRIESLYKAVLEAQQRAVEAIRMGVRSGEVDAAARGALTRRGLEKYFTHSTGHGVGLDIHEKPRLGRGDKTRLRAGCVVTAEPGVYLEGLGGIRLEDTVLVRDDGPEILTPAPMDRWIIS